MIWWAPILMACVFVSGEPGSAQPSDVKTQVADAAPRGMDEEFQLAPTADTAAELDQLIADLGNAVYSHRKEASKRIVDISAQALPQLRDAYRKSDDLEVRLRIEEIVLAIYLDYHVYNRNGFLGVSLAAYNRDWDRHAGPQVPEGVAGVFLDLVTRDTAADRAGLKAKDVIIAIDGKPLVGAGDVLRENVAALVRAHRPGTSMMLTIIRGAEEMEVEVILGRCSTDLMKSSRIIAIPELLAEAKAQFPEWWSRNFGSGSTKVDGKQGR